MTRMTGGCGSLVTTLLALTLAAPANAQSHAEHEVHAAVEQIFEGMRTANPDLVRAVFASDARFAGVDETGTVTVQSVEGWLEAIGTSERRWDERVYDVEIQVDGNMASAWTPYTFYLDGAVRHCGINSIEFLHDGSAWKVTQIADTRRTEGCPDPLGG